MRKRKKINISTVDQDSSESREEDNWLLTYSDMITLLLAFFVVLIAVSYVDITLWEQMKQGLRSEIMQDQTVRTPLAEIKADLDEMLAEEKEEGVVSIDLERDGIIMAFSSASFYDSGSADLMPRGQELVDKVVSALTALEFYRFNVDVEGHTDNVPITTPQFPSNWELSVARASNVIRYMIDEGIDPTLLKASGFAETQPVVPHTDEFGNDIIENRAINRRVVIRIYYDMRRTVTS